MRSDTSTTGPEDTPGLAGNGTDPVTPQDPSRRPSDLRTLIQNLKESERQLNARCSLLQGIFEGAGLAVFSVDTGYRYTSFNKKYADDIETLYGTAVRVKESLETAIPLDKDRRKIEDCIRQAISGKDITVSDYFGDYARKRRYYEYSCYPVCNETGLITGAAVIARDTTLQRQSEKELAEREELFRRITEGAPDILYRVSIPDGKFEYISPAALSATGYSPEEFIRRPGLLYEMVHSSGKDAFGRHLDNLLKGRNPPPLEFCVITKNGDERWWFLRTSLARDGAGHPVAYNGIITDVTAQKKEQTTLAEIRDRYRTIVESADAGIVLIDAATHGIDDANPRALEMIGASRDEVIGSACHRFICPAEAGMCPVTDLRKKVDESECAILTADGRSIPVIRTIVRTEIAGRDMLVESFVDISEMKKTEAALRENDERYRAFIANSSEGIFRIASDSEIPVTLPVDEQIALAFRNGYIAECNDVMARMYGYDRADDLTGRRIGDIIDPADPAVLDYVRQFIRDGYHITDYETGGRDRAGNSRWFAHTLNGVVHDGRVTHIWGVQRDITDRRKAELTLQESEKRYRALFEQSMDIVFTLSFSGMITSISPAVLHLLGYQPEEVIGAYLSDYLRPEAKQAILDEIERRKNTEGFGAFYEVDLHAKDGRYVPFEANITVRTNRRDGPDIIGIAREISERKKTEDALRESEQRFRALLQSVPSVAVQGFLPDYSLMYWNEASSRLFGYTDGEVQGKDIRGLLLPEETRAKITETCDRMAVTGIPAMPFELDLLNRDGSRVPVFVSHAVVKIPGKSTILFFVGVDLTERKAAETAVRDAEQRLQSILDAAPFGTFVFELRDDRNLHFVSANQSADRILGTDCGRFTGKTMELAFPGFTSSDLPASFRSVARGGEIFHNDAVEYRSENMIGILEIHAVPLTQNRVAVFFRDISERKKAEDELAQSETRFRALIQNSSDIIQILDKEKLLVYSSPSFGKILGYPEGLQNGKNLLELVHADDRRRVAADLEQVYLRSNPGTPTEYRMITSDGGSLYVESVGVNLLGVPGVDGIVINTHTVHERKQAEQAMQESEERFRLIFEHSNDSIYLSEITPSGMPGRIVDANDVAVRQTGYTKTELVQKSLLDLCSRDLSQRARALMMELLTRSETRFETETIRKDGSVLPAEISARLAKIRDRTYMIAISRDISRRKREERALRIANQKLQLMNIVAWHDIQNKVTGLRGYVELSKDLVTDDKLKKFIESEDDVLRVIHRQLQYTKEYQEMGIHPPQWVNLPQVLRMIMSFREMGPLAFRIEIRDLELYCDPVIEKVFSHLIENTQKHGVKATQIRISCKETADGITLLYEDDGIGIPDEKKKDLFVRGVGSATGFSLFFVHDILEISDMTIQETGIPGEGVRFEISVPRGLYRFGRE